MDGSRYFEAYRKELNRVNGQLLPRWENLHPESRMCWNAVAKAANAPIDQSRASSDIYVKGLQRKIIREQDNVLRARKKNVHLERMVRELKEELLVLKSPKVPALRIQLEDALAQSLDPHEPEIGGDEDEHQAIREILRAGVA